MSGRIRSILSNIALSAASLVVTVAILEFGVFRTILVPDDVLDNVSIDTVVRYAPHSRAVFRHPDGRQTLVTINAQGWNSSKPSYQVEKVPGRLRIAVIGDSYVHGTFVNVDQGFPDLLEKKLNRGGIAAEVYRFGMDGAPLSQYLHMLRAEVLKYKPDIVLIPLIHNDFDESYRFIKTRYSSSFMKLERRPDGGVREIAPQPFAQGRAEVLRHSAMFRYLYYETGLYLSAKGWISRYVWGGEEDWKPEFISSAVDVRKIVDQDSNRLYAKYVLAEMKALGSREGFTLTVMMDAVREAIYDGRSPDTYEVGKLNGIAKDLTRELGLPFVDLHDAFSGEYSRTKRRLEFAYDWHWNVRGNEIVAREAANLLLRDPGLLSHRLTQAHLSPESVGQDSSAARVAP